MSTPFFKKSKTFLPPAFYPAKGTKKPQSAARPILTPAMLAGWCSAPGRCLPLAFPKERWHGIVQKRPELHFESVGSKSERYEHPRISCEFIIALYPFFCQAPLDCAAQGMFSSQRRAAGAQFLFAPRNAHIHQRGHHAQHRRACHHKVQLEYLPAVDDQVAKPSA